MNTVVIKLSDVVSESNMKLNNMTFCLSDNLYKKLSFKLGENDNIITVSESVDIYLSSQGSNNTYYPDDIVKMDERTIVVNQWFLCNGKYVYFKFNENYPVIEATITFGNMFDVQYFGTNWGNGLSQVNKMKTSDIMFYNEYGNLYGVCINEAIIDTNYMTGEYYNFCINNMNVPNDLNLDDFVFDISVSRHIYVPSQFHKKETKITLIEQCGEISEGYYMRLTNTFSDAPTLRVNFSNPKTKTYEFHSSHFSFETVDDVNRFVENCKGFTFNNTLNKNIMIKPVPTIDYTEFVNMYKEADPNGSITFVDFDYMD